MALESLANAGFRVCECHYVGNVQALKSTEKAFVYFYPVIRVYTPSIPTGACKGHSPRDAMAIGGIG